MIIKVLNLFNRFKLKYLYFLFLTGSLYFTFTISNIYFNSLAGADNYKYMENILYIFGNSSGAYDNQGLLYYFFVSMIIKLRTESFDYVNNQNFIADSVESIFLSESIQMANLILFIFGLIGFYYFMKKIGISNNKSFLIILFFCYFPTFYYLRINMKPEVLAFALIPWIFFFFEDYLETKQYEDIVLISFLSAILVTSKGSIAAMVLICLFCRYIISSKSISLKQVGLGSFIFLIAWGSILGENYFLEIGNILDRQPEENYNNRADSKFIYSVDFERLRKDPKKDYHNESLLAITMIDLFSDYFELNWKEDSVLFSEKIKPLIVERDRDLNNINLKLFNVDKDNKHIVYSGPHPNYLKYQVEYFGLLFSGLFILSIIYNFFRVSKENFTYMLFPFFGIFVLLINSIFGIPQNNFDPAVGDTFKVFYYSFLIPFPLLIVLNNINFRKIRNLLITSIFLVFTFINLGFPKINDEKLDAKLVVNVENSVVCELNKVFIEPTLISQNKIFCKDTALSGAIKTDLKKIPYFSSLLLLISSCLIFFKINKNEA